MFGWWGLQMSWLWQTFPSAFCERATCLAWWAVCLFQLFLALESIPVPPQGPALCINSVAPNKYLVLQTFRIT